MEWQLIGSITTSSNYTFTPVVTGSLFKLKHITESLERSDLKIAIRQAFDDNENLALFDYKLINCKVEQDIVLFSLPKGLTNRKLAFKRIDNYLDESWDIEIESLNFVEEGVNLPITISDVTDLQQRLDAIQSELLLKALDLDLTYHTANTNNPHSVTAFQVGADPLGTAITTVVAHESTANHPLATTNSAGMFSAADKSKLDLVADGATANSSDSYLLDRANHQGAQAISTISNLQTALSNLEIAGTAITTVVAHESTINHPLATTSNAGMFSAADKSKLDLIANGATANAIDSYLLNRTNHQGAQAISTITNLQTTLNTFVNLSTNQNVGGVKTFTSVIQANAGIVSGANVQGIGFTYRSTPLNLEIVKTVPVVFNDFIEIGNLFFTPGGMAFRISLVVGNANFTLAKIYSVVTSYRAINSGWLKLNPDKSSNHNPNNDCEIDIRIDNATNYLRLRRVGSTFSNGTARVRIEFLGNTTAVFTETFLTGNDSGVTATY